MQIQSSTASSNFLQSESPLNSTKGGKNCNETVRGFFIETCDVEQFAMLIYSANYQGCKGTSICM